MNTNDDLVSHVEYFPIYDFSEFEGENPPLSDCKLILNDGEIIESHTLVLARGSQFFESAFTSGMAEDVNREVNITFNPQNLFPSVVKYLYSGLINVENDQIMSLFAIAKYYGISSLYNEVSEYLQTQTDGNNIIQLIQQCYEYELQSELDYLIPRIVQLLPSIDVGVLSDNLDLKTFCRILQQFKAMPNQKIELITSFLGDYQCTEQDIEEINPIFNSNNNTDMQIFCILLRSYNGDPANKIGMFTKFNGNHTCNKQDHNSILNAFDLSNPDVISAFRTLKPRWASEAGIHIK